MESFWEFSEISQLWDSSFIQTLFDFAYNSELILVLIILPYFPVLFFLIVEACFGFVTFCAQYQDNIKGPYLA